VDATKFSSNSPGLQVVIYPGDNKILIAMSLSDDAMNDKDKNLAGFAIWRQYDGKPEEILANRISFTSGVNNQTTAATRKWTSSDEAPFQKFRWIDVPADGFDVPITYRVRALYFTGQGHETKAGPEVKVKATPVKQRHTEFRPAFTRGYIASQAYADKFKNADIRPAGKKTLDFDPKPFEPQYAWLGADARTQLFGFIDDCEKDATAKVDVFAYDLDEPAVIAAICRMGQQGRLRAILDNAPLHAQAGKGAAPLEVEAAKRIIAAAGKGNVRQGHFARFQHNKVFIKRGADGKAERVIFGSMNFSLRGIYVQANNVVVVDDPKVAGMFADAFDEAFKTDVMAAPFQGAPISQSYMVGSAQDSAALPKFSLALSPHKDAGVSLDPMADRIRNAKSSVFFAVMAPTGGGPVLASLRTIAAKPTVFSYGTVETDSGLAVQSPDGEMGVLTSFAALIKNVPAPFDKEFSGGMGMHIHDKFVVVDFNADNPTVFTGSSNLASGGETANGDSLAMIEDAAIANMFAIEAVALFDHYHFRKVMQQVTKQEPPLTLWYPGKPNQPTPWWKSAYDKSRIQMRDRLLFAGLPLPAGLAATKNVDWSAIDAAAAKTPAKGGKKAPAKNTVATKASTNKASTAKDKAKKVSAKKVSAEKASAKKASAKKASAKKASAKKAPAKKAPAKKVAAKKTAVKKTQTKKAPAKKAPAKRAPAKKAAAAKKAIVKKSATKKAPARKTPAKALSAKAAPRRRTAPKAGASRGRRRKG
jgi:hypothetical protein